MAAALLFGASPASAGVLPPRVVTIQSLSDLIVPDYPFSEYADADADVAHAFAQARAQNKRVLIDLGGNWCADCRILSGIMELPEVRRFLDTYYVIAIVDVGRFNRNLQIPARFGITARLEAVPCILIANPDGRLVNGGHTFALDDARSMAPQEIVDWLATWAR
ncbi:MAG: thioredoxin family protein [Rhizomicrobium sp.]